MSVVIRASTDADLSAITAIYGWNVLNGLGTFEEIPPDEAEMARRRRGFLDRGLPYLVAELDGKVLGYCYAGPFRLRAAYRYTVEDSVYVSPQAVGAGVGKALLSQLSDDDVRRIVARTGMPAQTANTITEPDALIADLELIRHRGYAVDEGEQEVGVRCFAVPVPNAPTPTALSVSGPAARVTLGSADRIVPLLKRVSKELSEQYDEKPVHA